MPELWMPQNILEIKSAEKEMSTLRNLSPKMKTKGH